MGPNPNPIPILFLVTVFFAAQSLANRIPDAHDILRAYDLPVGILPEGVYGYDLDTSTGRFAARFNGTCSFSLEGSYQLRFGSTIRGHISKGVVSGLEGVGVKILLVWVDVVEVRRIGDDLGFFVGIAGADFPVDGFGESPTCGCGFKCCGAAVLGSSLERGFLDSGS